MRKFWRFALAGIMLAAGAFVIYTQSFSGRAAAPAYDQAQPYDQWLEGHGQIVIASRPDNPPFYFTKDGSIYYGFDQDLVNGLEMALSADFRLLSMTTQEALAALSHGEIDGIMGMEQQPDWAQYCSFSQPYVTNSQAIFVARGRANIQSLADLGQLTVAVVADTPGAFLVESRPGIRVMRFGSVATAINELVRGTVEAFVGDELVGRNLIQENKLEDLIMTVGEPINRRGYTIAVRKGNAELVSLLNTGLGALEKTGLREEMYRSWFGDPSKGSQPLPTQLFLGFAGISLLMLGVIAGISAKGRSLSRTVDERTYELQETEQRQRILIENANDAIFSIHPADTSILEANRKAEEFTGHRRESLLHMRLSDIFPEDSREHSVGRLLEVLLNGSGSFDDMAFLRRDGTRIDVDISASVIEFDRRKVIQILARDVTERKAMERELRRRNRNLLALNSVSATLGRSIELDEILDAALDKVLDVVGADMGAIYLFDEDTGNLVLRVYRGEPPVLAVQSPGFAEDGDPMTVTATNGNVAQFANAWWPSASQSHLGSFVSAPLRAKEKLLGVMNVATRKQRWFSQEDVDLLTAVSNQISVAIENAMLFTELRTAIGDLFVVKQFNENVLQSMTNGLTTVDLSGRVTSLNLAASRITGYSKESLLGKPLQQVLISSNGLNNILEETLQKGAPCLNRETSITHKDGYEIPIGLNTSPLRDNQGVLTGLLLVFNDLSDMKKMEDEKRKLDRLAALGEMAAVLAHEMRNPLASISAGIQMLARKITAASEQRSLQLVLDEVERLNRLIENVLMISRPPGLDLAPAQVSDIMETVLTRWHGKAAERRVRISKHYSEGLSDAMIDPLRMDQALSNLVGNALDAMPNGGDLRVSIRKVRLIPQAVPAQAGAAAQQTLIGPEEWIRVEVADTGVGIPEDKLPRIFEPFVTTKAKGTGLGLAIARRIVSDHQGQISVRSKEGVGTVFTIDLPVAA